MDISIFTPEVTERAITPTANAPVAIKPIAASELILDESLILNSKKAEIITIGIANSIGAIFKTVAIAKAPNATCDKPSPIMEYRFKTNGTPKSEEHTANGIPARNARKTNGNENISIKKSKFNSLITCNCLMKCISDFSASVTHFYK